MTPLTLTMIVLAAVIHAVWNLLAKLAAPAGNHFAGAYLMVSAAAFLPVAVWLMEGGGIVWSWPVAACVAATCVIQSVYTMGLQKGYAISDLTVIYPVTRGSGVLFSALGAFVVLGERPSVIGMSGLAVLTLGIIMIATNGRPSALVRREALTGLVWGIGMGLLIACFVLVDGYAIKRLAVDPFLLGWFANVFGAVALVLPMLRSPAATEQRMRGHWRSAAIVGLIAPLSYYLVMKAVQMGGALSLVAPAREMSIMLATLLGAVVLHETVGPGRWLGCASVLAGVLLLANG